MKKLIKNFNLKINPNNWQQYVISSLSIGNHFFKTIVWKDAYYIASLWKRCRLYLLGGGLISVVISSWSALPKRFVSRNSSPNRRGRPSRNAVNSTPSDWCYHYRHMALVLSLRHPHALVLNCKYFSFGICKPGNVAWCLRKWWKYLFAFHSCAGWRLLAWLSQVSTK